MEKGQREKREKKENSWESVAAEKHVRLIRLIDGVNGGGYALGKDLAVQIPEENVHDTWQGGVCGSSVCVHRSTWRSHYPVHGFSISE